MRLAGIGAGIAALLAVSGCGAVPKSGVAASVGGEEISVERVEAFMQAYSSVEGGGVVPDEATGTVDGGFARNVVSLFVTVRATNEFLAANGESITDEDRQAVLDQIPETDPARQLPEESFDLLVDLSAGQSARARVQAPDPAALQDEYERSPGDLGVLCVRHVLLENEADAQGVLDEVLAGTPLEDLAVERSTDPSAATNGGAIEIQPGQACTSVEAARTAGLVGPFIDAALTAAPGAPVGPVQTDFGWHVIEARPFDEVVDSLAAIYGDLQFASYLEDLDVQVDPRYGRWDADSGQVVEL